MISYINFAILAGIIIYSIFLLKHNGKVTQKHLDGDWRQAVFEFFDRDNFFEFNFYQTPALIAAVGLIIYITNDDASRYFSFDNYLSLYFLFSFVGCLFSILVYKNEHKLKGIDELLIVPLLLFCLSQAPFWITNYLLYSSIKKISNFIYYNPDGSYVLLKHNNNYGVRSLSKYPGQTYPGLLQFFGKNKISSFKTEDDIFDAIFNLKNKGMIIYNFSSDTLEKWLKWKDRKELKAEAIEWYMNDRDDLNISNFYNYEE